MRKLELLSPYSANSTKLRERTHVRVCQSTCAVRDLQVCTVPNVNTQLDCYSNDLILSDADQVYGML